MFKRMIGLSLFLANSVYAEDIPPPPPPTSPLVPMLPLPYYHKPDSAVYMTKEEYQAISNIYNIQNKIFIDIDFGDEKKSKQSPFENLSLPNYSIDLGKNKKEKVLQVIKNAVDKKENFYQVFGMHYTLKYSKQCPIDFKNNGTLDKDICHETYDEYLHKKRWETTIFILHGGPTFWHDTQYYVPDKKYISNKVKDVLVENKKIHLNYSNVCIKDKDIFNFFNIKDKINVDDSRTMPFSKINNNESYYSFLYHNKKITVSDLHQPCIVAMEIGD